MSLVEFYQQADPRFFIAVMAVVLSLLLMFVLVILFTIMGFILSPKLDPELYNERWFTHAELAIFSYWPFSMIKTGVYLALIGFPERMLKTKRFKGLDIELDPHPLLLLIAKMSMFMIFTAILCGLVFFAMAIYASVAG